MVVDEMIEAAMVQIKQNLRRFCQEQAEEPLTACSAEEVTKGIQHALAATGKAAYRAYLEANEEDQDIVVADGETYRFKYFSEKTFVSLWGDMPVRRKIFQNAKDSKTHVPLDAAWDMVG